MYAAEDLSVSSRSSPRLRDPPPPPPPLEVAQETVIPQPVDMRASSPGYQHSQPQEEEMDCQDDEQDAQDLRYYTYDL